MEDVLKVILHPELPGGNNYVNIPNGQCDCLYLVHTKIYIVVNGHNGHNGRVSESIQN